MQNVENPYDLVTDSDAIDFPVLRLKNEGFFWNRKEILIRNSCMENFGVLNPPG